MKRFILATCLALFFAPACGPSVRPHEDVFEDGPDAGPTGPTQEECEDQLASDLWPMVCGDECTSLRYDENNCGVCENDCGLSGDRCDDGACGCGETGGTCSPGTVCIPALSQCLVPDLSGAPCGDIDLGDDCADPQRVCVSGYCTVPNPSPEICDGNDNDLDGYVDEDDGGGPIAEFCYTGTPGTAGIGACHQGYRVCVGGTMSECTDEVTPIDEIGVLKCDGLDNDCDNCADGDWADGNCVVAPPLLVDTVFVIDRSGSMSGPISAVVTAVDSLTSTLGMNPNFMFALVDPTDGLDPDGVSVTLPISDYAAFSTALAGVSADGSGSEPMHYAAQMIASGAFNAELGFRPGSLRVIISIGDESTTAAGGNAVPGYDETSMCTSIASTGTLLAVVTDPTWFTEWDACTSSAPMPPSPVPQTAFQLSNDATTMLSNLNLAFESACGP